MHWTHILRDSNHFLTNKQTNGETNGLYKWTKQKKSSWKRWWSIKINIVFMWNDHHHDAIHSSIHSSVYFLSTSHSLKNKNFFFLVFFRFNNETAIWFPFTWKNLFVCWWFCSYKLCNKGDQIVYFDLIRFHYRLMKLIQIIWFCEWLFFLFRIYLFFNAINKW